MRDIDYIVCHTTATELDTNIDTIKHFWKEHLGWNSYGYHFMIAKDGKITNITPIDKISNGVRGYNSNSIHIANIGGKDDDDRTDAQKEAMRGIVATMKAMFPKAKIVGHRDLSPDLNGDGIITSNEWIKLCPRFDAMIEYKDLM